MTDPIVLSIPRKRMAAAAVLFAATAVVLLHDPGQQASGQSRGQCTDLRNIPREVTPEIVAMRGCLEKVVHPSGETLTPAAQQAACNDWVRLAPDDIQARYFRGLFLLDHATGKAGQETAFADMSAVIAAKSENPTAFFRRAMLQAQLRGNLEAALADIDRAIALAEERPRARYFEARATFRLQIANRTGDPEAARAALEDARKASALDPASEVVPKIESLVYRMLEAFARTNGEAADPAARSG